MWQSSRHQLVWIEPALLELKTTESSSYMLLYGASQKRCYSQEYVLNEGIVYG